MAATVRMAAACTAVASSSLAAATRKSRGYRSSARRDGVLSSCCCSSLQATWGTAGKWKTNRFSHLSLGFHASSGLGFSRVSRLLGFAASVGSCAGGRSILREPGLRLRLRRRRSSLGEDQVATPAIAVAASGYKLKTHKASAKRFRVTGSGKIQRRRAGKQHLLVKKTTKRRKRLSKMSFVKICDSENITKALPYLKVAKSK